MMEQQDNSLSNWSDEKKEKYAEILRKMSEHEDNLRNTRFSWFATLQGLLFAGLAFVWKENTSILIGIICLLGALVAISSRNAINLCSKAQEEIQDWWDKNLPDYQGPMLVALRTGRKMTFARRMRPWRIIPVVFFGAWLVIFAYRLFRDFWLPNFK